jgi:SAM-dependent methyltransferase
MAGVEDSYSISAKYYDDEYAVKQDLVDLPFYLDLAEEKGGPILEIACGTGRVLLPLARRGIEIHGIDNSAPMLAVLRQKLLLEEGDVQRKVKLSAGDMRSFRGTAKYNLVTIPFRPMQHMYSLEDQIAALETAAFHMDRNGILAFDVFYPKWDAIVSGIGEEKLELEWRLRSDPKTIVRRYFRKDSVDKINQYFTATFFYRTTEGEKLINEEKEPLKMAFYTYPQCLALFKLTGLHIVEQYGSFSKAPLDNDAEQMIFLLRKAS